MADVQIMNPLDAVYAKWQQKSTVNGARVPTSKAYNHVAEEGRKAWKVRFKELPPQPERRTRKSRNTRKPCAMPTTPLTATLGNFKRAPGLKPSYNLYMRPMTGRCCTCMPISRDTFAPEGTLGRPEKTNVLRLPHISCQHSTLLSLFSNIAYTYRHTVRFGYPNITESVVRSHRTQLAVERTVQECLEIQGVPLDEKSKEYKKEKKKCEGKLKKMFQLMRAVMSIPIFKLTGWFLNTVLGYLLHSIQVQNSQLSSLKDASLSGKPVIYLPMHRSHLDYVLITYILWHYGIRAPYVAAGDNLNIFGFGQILRSLGGFFIRRRFDKEEGKKDHLYRAVLSEYVQELLKHGQSLEFFIEGGRSRSGKAYYPKAGLLAIVVNWVLESRNDTDGILRNDALIVPVSISYEKIMDGNFTREQMGMPKKPESFWATVKAIWKLFSTTFGNIRVDFSQPFSLKEYLTVNKGALQSTVRRADSPIAIPGMPSVRDSMQDLQALGQSEAMLPRTESDNSIYGIDMRKDDEKVVIGGLAKHIIYNGMQSAAVMSTNVIAFDLLNKHRSGVCLVDLIQSVDTLRETILNSNRDLGFVGKSRDIIAHACRLLGPKLVSLDKDGAEATWCDLYDEENRNIRLTPNLSLPHILELSYYSSPVLTVFQMKSLIACSVCAATGVTLLDGSSLDRYSATSFTKESVLEYAVYLADVMKYEYLFTAPCKDFETELDETFESLISQELFTTLGVEDTYNEEAEQWTSNIVRRTMYGFDTDDMDDFASPEKEYKLNPDEKELFRSLTSVLQPMIESYWVTCCQLEPLLTTDQPFTTLSKSIHEKLISRVEQGVTSYPESVAQDMVRNALHSLSDLGVTEYYDIANEKMASITDEYNSAGRLNELISRIDSYKSD
ncbi:glycerol-3-phosphate acyltransferase 1, mitochondrial-like [Watersipora subatra]|uniref:glycerol-3-phosphate acyltransferase 1, mitochondrial-like n=1 Tax=Watersipora subatra TaxID=2589382 RepID=UPI00355BB7CD